MIHRLTIFVTEEAKMVSFYEAILGIKLTKRTIGKTYSWVGQTESMGIQLIPNIFAGVRGQANRFYFSVVVEDLEELVFEKYGITIGLIDTHDKEMYCNLTDPDGNSLELVQLL